MPNNLSIERYCFSVICFGENKILKCKRINCSDETRIITEGFDEGGKNINQILRILFVWQLKSLQLLFFLFFCLKERISCSSSDE